MIGLGNNLNELKIRIQKIHGDLAKLDHPGPALDELIGTTNALRLNDYLTKTDAKKTELIATYEEYSKQLEQIISSLFSIQADLKDILKEETSLIDSDTKKKTRKRKQH